MVMNGHFSGVNLKKIQLTWVIFKITKFYDSVLHPKKDVSGLPKITGQLEFLLSKGNV